MARKKNNASAAPKQAAAPKAQAAAKPASPKAAPKPEPVVSPPSPKPNTPEDPVKKKTRRGGKKKGTAIDPELLKTQPMTKPQLDAVRTAEKALKALGNGELSVSQKEQCRDILNNLEKAENSFRVKVIKAKRPSPLVEQDLEELRQVSEFADFVPAKEAELLELKASESFCAFRDAANKLRNKWEGRCKSIIVSETVTKVQDDTVDRIASVMGVSSSEISASDIAVRNIDLEEVTLGRFFELFVNKKLEKEYRCLIQNAARMRGGGGRGVNISGTSELIQCAVAAVRDIDLSVVESVELEGRTIAAVVGPMGSTAREIEKDCGVIVHTPKNEGKGGAKGGSIKVNIYGSKAGVALAMDRIRSIQEDVGKLGETETKKIPADKGHFFRLEDGKEAQQAIQSATGIEVRVWSSETEASITLKGPSLDKINEIWKKRFQPLLDSISVQIVKGDRQGLEIVMGTNNAKRNYDLIRRVNAHKEHSSIALTEEGIRIVGKKEYADKAVKDIKDMVEFSMYEPVPVELHRQQFFVFRKPEIQDLISTKSKCQVSVDGPGREDDTPAFVKLTGSEKNIAEGRKVIAEIIEREATVASLTVCADTRQVLITQQGHKIRTLEDQHGVQIRCENGQDGRFDVQILGSKLAVKDVKEEIAKLDEMENSMPKKELTIADADKPRIIGTRGATINSMSRDFNVRADLAKGSNTLTLRGTEENIAACEAFIKDLLSRKFADENDENDSWEYQVPVPEVVQKKPKKQEPVDLSKEDLFPTLGSAVASAKGMNKKSRRGMAA